MSLPSRPRLRPPGRELTGRRASLRRRFQQNQEDCTFTVLALLPTATANIVSLLNTEQITYEIQQAKSAAKGPAADSASPPSIADTALTDDDGKSLASLQSESGVHASQIAAPSPSGHDAKARKTKRQLWDSLTISGTSVRPSVHPSTAAADVDEADRDAAVTRAFTLVYTLALLAMLTRIQLNLLGRRSYLSSVVSLATGAPQATISLENNDDDKAEHDYGNDFDTNRKYLTFSWWLLNKGCVEVMQRVEAAVRTVFGALSPRDLLSFDRFGELTMEVRRLVEGSTPDERRASDWLKSILPPRHREADVIRQSGILDDNAPQGGASQPSPAALRRLLDETADLIESPAFAHVLTLVLDAAFSLLVDGKLAAEAFDLDVQAPAADAARSKAVLLPKILSVLTRQAHAIGSGMPNEYLERMEAVRAVEAFAAVVYSSNWENEMQGEGLLDGVQGPSPQAKSGDQGVGVEALGGLEAAWERATGAR